MANIEDVGVVTKSKTVAHKTVVQQIVTAL